MLRMLRTLPRLYRKLTYVIIGVALITIIYSLSNYGERLKGRVERKHGDDDHVAMAPVVPMTAGNDRNSDGQRQMMGGESEGKDIGRDKSADDNDTGDGDDDDDDDVGPADPDSELAEVDLETPNLEPTEESVSERKASDAVKSGQTFSGPQNAEQKAIVAAFLHAWNGYKKYAWGMDELRPLSKSGQHWMGVGLTIVDSLDTIIIMGLTEEYKVAREWVANNLNFDHDGDIQLFEMTIRVLGGLLSVYHLTGDELFLNKAIELGTKFAPCFEGATKIPCNRINLKRQQPSFIDISTAESGSVQLEFRDLSRSSNDTKFEEEANAVSNHLHGLKKLDGLVSCFLNPTTGTFQLSTVSVGASADSYYEYLLKQWIQTGKTREWLKADYLEAVEGIKKHLLRYSEPSRLAYVGALPSASSIGHVRNEMEHLACFLPGTLALGTIHGLDSSHLQLAADLTRTCYKMYEMMPTKLSPEIAIMNTDINVKEDISTQYHTRFNQQRPEAVESIFYMHRATKNPMYREWGWKIFEAFEKYTKVDAGYATIENVQSPDNPGYKDKMETFYLAETLKYLYLLFSDDPQLLPLDKFVMNTEAHPLPVYDS